MRLQHNYALLSLCSALLFSRYLYDWESVENVKSIIGNALLCFSIHPRSTFARFANFHQEEIELKFI